MLLATALDQAGQPGPAQLKLANAHACFDRLGARLDAEAAAGRVVKSIGTQPRPEVQRVAPASVDR